MFVEGGIPDTDDGLVEEGREELREGNGDRPG